MKKTNEVKFNEKQLLDLYGIMFSMAYADGELDKEELKAIYEIINTDGFSKEGIEKVHSYLIAVPDLEYHINNVKVEIKELKFTCYVNATEVAYSNDLVTEGEEALLKRLRDAFGITSEQDAEIRKFVKEVKRIKERGIDDKYAEDALKSAFAGLAAVGVPIAAVYFCGAVVGLSAAGITSGLAALGLGLGMVPGIGVAIAIGATIFLVLSKVFDIGGNNSKEKAAKERERRAQQVIKNLQEAINFLINRVNDLEKKAKDAQANKEAITNLTKRMTILKQMVENKKGNLKGHVN